MMNAFIGLDLGTSTIKGLLLAGDGRILARERVATELIRTGADRVEFSSERCFDLTAGLIKRLLKSLPDGMAVAGISLSGATGNTVLLDDSGNPLCNAISWLDTRTADAPEYDPPPGLIANVYKTVGWPWFRGFPLAHLAWLKKNDSGSYTRAGKICMNITYLYHRLCGAYGMDYSTATTFYLQKQTEHKWHKEHLDWLGIRSNQLPPLYASGHALGRVNQAASEQTGLPMSTSVVLGSFDHPSAARGCGVFAPGDVLLSCGTSWVGFYPVAQRDLPLSQNMLVDPYLSADGGPWGAMFSLARVGDNVREFVEKTFPEGRTLAEKYEMFNAAASDKAAGSGKACRAIMEQISNDMSSKIASLEDAGLNAERIVMVGGPTESKVWTEILSDAVGRKISIPAYGAYAGALGAAIMAGKGCGNFSSDSECFDRIDHHGRG